MNQINLFPEKYPKQQDLDKDNEKFEAKRPDKLAVTKQHVINDKWRQCKIIGKNINIRSYSGACAFQKKMFIYGGYQILKGMMSDFYSINLDDNVQKFNWQPIQAKGDLPGPRSKHALVGGKRKIYLVCGLSSDIHSSDQIYEFDAEKRHWTLLKPSGDKLPEVDSFGFVYISAGDEEKIVIVCGYDGKNAQYLNSVYEYNITKNKVSILFPGTKGTQNNSVPAPRSGCATATDGKSIYVFGGKDAEKRMNDMWEFSLSDFKYHKLEQQGDVPPQRNGHTMQYFGGKLYVFGGIHDITWQLDDLHIYNISKKKWRTLEHDSPRSIDKNKSHIENISKQKLHNDKKSPKKKNWYQTVNTLYNNKSSIGDSPSLILQNTHRQQQHIQSPHKMIQQQRKKAFLHRKSEMLKNFQVPKNQSNRYVMLQAESQAIKNSLDVIGDPDPKKANHEGKITQFGKQTASKFLQPLTNNSNLIVGKKPCARDGHTSIVLNDELIIFGGDRHQMSFSDIYKLNFTVAGKNQ